MVDSGDLALFKPSSDKQHNLKGVAMLGKHPALCLNVCLSDEAQSKLALDLVQLGRAISRVKAQDFLCGRKTILPAELILKGKTKWDSAIGQVSDSHSAELTDEGKSTYPAEGHCSDEALYRCPCCEIAVRSTSTQFQVNDLDRRACCRVWR